MNASISRLVVIAALVVLPLPALAKGPGHAGPGGRPGIQCQVGKPGRPMVKPGSCCSAKPQMRPKPACKKHRPCAGKRHKARRFSFGCAWCR